MSDKYQRPMQPYALPSGCAERSCLNFAGGRTVPVETYWLCKACSSAACNAFELGYARRPLAFYSNSKPWGPEKRAEWTRSTNASMLTTQLLAAKRGPPKGI